MNVSEGALPRPGTGEGTAEDTIAFVGYFPEIKDRRTLRLQFILLVLAIVIMHKNEDGLPLTKGLTKSVFHNFNCF